MHSHDTSLDRNVELARCGDKRAQASLLNAHWDRCVAGAFERLGDLHRAEDAAQEALAYALTRIGQLRSSGAFPVWLRRIVRTKSNEIARKNRSITMDLGDRLVDPAPAIEDVAERQQQMAAVRTAVRALSDPLRLVTRMFYFDRMRMSQICNVVGLPLTTVKKRLHDSRRTLRNRMISREEAVERIRASDCPWAEVMEESVLHLQSNQDLTTRHAIAFRSGDVQTLRGIVTDDYMHFRSRDIQRDVKGLLQAAHGMVARGEDPRVLVYDVVAEADRVVFWPTNLEGHDCLVFCIEGDKVACTVNATVYPDEIPHRFTRSPIAARF